MHFNFGSDLSGHFTLQNGEGNEFKIFKRLLKIISPGNRVLVYFLLTSSNKENWNARDIIKNHL